MNFELMPLIALAATVVLIGVLIVLHKKNVDFGVRTLIAMFFGVILGLIFPQNLTYVAPIGTIYVRLISAIVIPLLFTSVISSISSMKDTVRLKNIGLKAVGWLMTTAFLGAVLALAISLIFKLGSGMDIALPSDYVAREVPSFIDTLIALFPSNIISDAAEGKIVPIILFSVFIGIAIVALSKENEETVAPFKSFIHSFGAIISYIICILVELTPYAVLALIGNAVANNGADKLLPLIIVLLISYLSCFMHTFLIQGGLIALVARLNPIKFFRGSWEAMVVAFTSQSSVGTLPITMRCLTNHLGVSEEISSFVAPLGTTVGMPGCSAIWPVTLAVVAINALGIDFSVGQYIFLIFITVVISIGTVGVPGTSTITTTAIFAATGLPIEIIVIMLPISTIVDMARTMTNVTAAMTASVLVAKGENSINQDVYNRIGSKTVNNN